MALFKPRKGTRRWSLKSLRVFEVCARHESFTNAADELCVTQSAVSKQIRSLEEGLGLTLFDRDAKAIKLTPAGVTLSRHLTGLFSDLDGLINELGDGNISEPLVVSCERTICLKLLIPLMPEIQSATGLDVRVLAGGGAVDFRKHHVDLAIRRNDFSVDMPLHVKTLGSEYVGPVIIPSVRDESGDSPIGRVRIHANTRPDAWLNWHEQTGIKGDYTDRFFEHHYLALEATESGLGASLMSVHMVARSLEQGKVIAPFGFVPDGSKYICLSHTPIEEDQRKMRFFNWFQSRMKQNLEFVSQIPLSASNL